MNITLIYAGWMQDSKKLPLKQLQGPVETILHGNGGRTHETPADFSPSSPANQIFGLFLTFLTVSQNKERACFAICSSLLPNSQERRCDGPGGFPRNTWHLTMQSIQICSRTLGGMLGEARPTPAARTSTAAASKRRASKI